MVVPLNTFEELLQLHNYATFSCIEVMDPFGEKFYEDTVFPMIQPCIRWLFTRCVTPSRQSPVTPFIRSFSLVLYIHFTCTHLSEKKVILWLSNFFLCILYCCWELVTHESFVSYRLRSFHKSFSWFIFLWFTDLATISTAKRIFVWIFFPLAFNKSSITSLQLPSFILPNRDTIFRSFSPKSATSAITSPNSKSLVSPYALSSKNCLYFHLSKTFAFTSPPYP